MAANKVELDSRSLQISKPGDLQGPDNPIPLSPQWLLPKSGESRSGLVPGENLLSPQPGHARHSDVLKSPGIGEELLESHKKKDVFRPSVLDMESGRRDRWRDEERDTNPSARRDRWRDGDKVLGDNRKVDRFTEPSGRHYGEARRAQPERWSESGGRETNIDQRRDSKWNTRWGPDDKVSDSGLEKWMDSNKDVDLYVDKGSSNLTFHGKDEKEGDQYRPWRSYSSRGRGEPPLHQSLTPNKPVPTFFQGRGRGESSGSTLSLGRGKVVLGGSSVNSISSHTQPPGSFSEKVEAVHREPSLLRYQRTKLLDIYRVTDMKTFGKYLDGSVQVQVPSLSQEEPVEPLAFCAPSPEELVILKGIDKGDIVNSGAPQITKDGPMKGSSTDFMQSRRSRLGSREDIPLDDSKGGTTDNARGDYSESLSRERQMRQNAPNVRVETISQAFTDNKFHREGEDSPSYRKNVNVPVSREPVLQAHSSVPHGGAWRSPSIGEHAHSASHDRRDLSSDFGSRTSEIGWSQSQKDLNNERDNSLAYSSYSKKEGFRWQMGNGPILKRQPSSISDKELEIRKPSEPSPEDLVLYYKDPQGAIQGPFSGIDIIGWFEAGYFGIDLPVRVAGAPAESPFSLLGDVMPHLRAKARPPPGFSAAKVNEVADALAGSSISTFGKLHPDSSDINKIKNEPTYAHGSGIEAENRFIESLISGKKGTAPEGLAGMPGYIGNNSTPLPPSGSESGDNQYLLSKKLSLDQQRSLPNPYSYWPGRESASLIPKSEISKDTTLQQPSFFSSIADNVRQQQPHTQNVDLVSLLQGVSDRSNAGANNGASGWSNFLLQGGVDSLQDKLALLPGQNFPPQAPFGVQQQSLQQQIPPVTNFLAHVVDNPASILTPEKILSAGLSQDPQLLSLLQQQQLLQLQSQAPVAQQLSVLDKLFLLKQQQKQEEQQQLLRWQQQHLLSQVLSENQAQGLAEPQYGQLHSAGLSLGNVPMDQSRCQPSPGLFQIGSQTLIPSMQDERVSNFVLTSTLSQPASQVVDPENSSITLPHQMCGDTVHQRSGAASLREQVEIMQRKDLLETVTVMESLPHPENMQCKASLDQTLLNSNSHNFMLSQAASSILPVEQQRTYVAPSSKANSEHEIVIPEQVSDVDTPTTGAHKLLQVEGEQLTEDSSSVNEVKNVERHEVKKLEKKSKKQKASKTQASDPVKGMSKAQQSKPSKFEGMQNDNGNVKSEMESISGDSSTLAFYAAAADTRPSPVQGQETVETKGDSGQGGSTSQVSAQVSTGQRAWKPAPGFKPKSLLEIQQEEQRRAHAEITVSEISTSVSSMGVSTPWAGMVANSDHKSLREIQQDPGSPESVMTKLDSFPTNKSKKIQPHSLSVENNVEIDFSDGVSSKTLAFVGEFQNESVEDDNFIEAKDTKKSRKKSGKSKSAGSKVSAVPIAAMPVESRSVDKSKTSRQVPQEKELLPAVPSGPSLGDFVVWKGESANSSPAPAWSADSGKLSNPTSLRDILKEQERKVPSEQQQIVQTPQKATPSQSSRGGGSSWSSPSSKVANPIQINSNAASHSKYKADDDFFWGPTDQPKQDPKQSEFPQLVGSWGSKNTPPKGTPAGSMSRQKSISGRPASSPVSTQSVPKGKKNALTKQSEAMDFRDWCQSECVRLIGTKDTSFLEFCLKQSRSEAEMFLIENLGSFDPDHEFIEKFLNYKDLLPADVLEMAFQIRDDRKATGSGAGDMASDIDSFWGSDPPKATAPDKTTKSGGKKKGKKGKTVSPSVLGFNVVSNRIMMGEIQTVED